MSDVGKPTLEAVLEHYQIPHSPGRKRQMIACPFHEDLTPSMSIDLNKQLYNCHSCGQGGDSWTLIEKKEGTDFLGARAYAASVGLVRGGEQRPASGGRRKSARAGYKPRYRRP